MSRILLALALLAPFYSHAAGIADLGHHKLTALGAPNAQATSAATSGTQIELVTRYTRDAKGRITRTDFPDGSFRTTEYNPIDKPAKECDALNRCVERSYDGPGRESEIRYPDGTRVTKAYDGNGNLIAETDRSGRATKFVFDPADRLTETVHPDDTPATDDDNPRSRSVYDAAGRQTASIDPAGQRTNFVYDDASRRTAVIDAQGNTTRTVYDVAGRPTANIDAQGRRTEFRLDDAGKIIETVLSDGTSIKAEYDVMGRKTADVRQSNKRTEYQFDALGRLIAVPMGVGSADSATTSYSFDEVGNKLTQTDAEGRVTRWSYDNGARAISRTLPDGQQETDAYNIVGERIAHTDFNGDTTRFTHDAVGQVKVIDYPSDPDVAIAYRAEKPTQINDGNGTTRFNYHARGWLTGIEYPNGEAVAYKYDAAGNRIELLTANQRLRYTYDSLNRLKSVADDHGTTTYEYDNVGNRAAVVRPNGTRTEYGYNLVNRLTSVVHKTAVGALLFSVTYTVDSTGLRTGAEERDSIGVARTVFYVYDELNRLIAEAIVSRDSTQSRNTTWTYDRVGNRQTQTLTIGGVAITTNYTYDRNDRLLTEVTAGQTTSFTYDANGNTLRKSGPNGVVDYSYSDAHRLVEMREGGTRVTYAYNTDGLRISQTNWPTGGGVPVTTFYLLDKSREYAQVIEEHTQLGSGPRTLSATYTFGDDLISQTRGASTQYVHADGMSSTRLLTDASGTVTDSFVFDAFGNELARNGVSSIAHLFRGEQFDPNLGFYNLRARYYDPKNGRFPTMDSFPGVDADPPSLHKYLYANADPVNGRDPSGHMTLTELTVGLTIGGALTGAAIGGYYDGWQGAATGAAVGGITGYLAGFYAAPALFAYVPGALILAQTWITPASRFIQGPSGRVAINQLDRLSSTNAVTLYTNLSRQVEFTRAISTSTSQALASAGGRINYQTFIFRVPQGVLDELRHIGLVHVSVTNEAGVIAYEYKFYPAAAAYISKFLQL